MMIYLDGPCRQLSNGANPNSLNKIDEQIKWIEKFDPGSVRDVSGFLYKTEMEIKLFERLTRNGCHGNIFETKSPMIQSILPWVSSNT